MHRQLTSIAGFLAREPLELLRLPQSLLPCLSGAVQLQFARGIKRQANEVGSTHIWVAVSHLKGCLKGSGPLTSPISELY